MYFSITLFLGEQVITTFFLVEPGMYFNITLFLGEPGM